MSLLKQIDDKGAVLEWSPVPSQANLVALGTKVRSQALHSFPSLFKLLSFVLFPLRIPLGLVLMTMVVNWRYTC